MIVLGTNNAGDESDLVRLADAIEVVGTLRNPSNPQEVYWVTPYRDPRYTGELSGTDLGAFNAALAEAAARLDWLHVVDFAGAAAFHPQWFDADGSHLHPDEVGNAVLAALVAGPDAVPLLTPEPVSSSS